MKRGGIYLAIGDSTTWTIPTVSEARGKDLYATKLKNQIMASKGPIRLINKGIGGTNSAEILTGLPWNSRIDADLITLCVGTNDCPSNVIPVVDYTANVGNIVDDLKRRASGAAIILCAPAQLGAVTHEPYVADYRTAMAAVAVAQSVGFCDFSTAWLAADNATYLVGDLIHPNIAGHDAIFNVLWPVVQVVAATQLGRLKAA